MSLTALQLAEYTIRRAVEKETPITNLKLQKTLYYIQGYSLRVFDSPAFDETISHWQYGPVVPIVYFTYSTNGAAPLCVNDATDVPALSKEQCNLYNKVIDKCLFLSARELVEKRIRKLHGKRLPTVKSFHMRKSKNSSAIQTRWSLVKKWITTRKNG